MARTTLEVMRATSTAPTTVTSRATSRQTSRKIACSSRHGRFEGHDGIRAAAALLMEQVKDGKWRYIRLDVEGDIAFLEWTGDGSNSTVSDGADSFLIRDGKVPRDDGPLHGGAEVAPSPRGWSAALRLKRQRLLRLASNVDASMQLHHEAMARSEY